ncbi:MAG: 4-alpha-glucanotransferase [Cyclobacteriaceae bacterium]
MILKFEIEYHTQPGEQLFISGKSEKIGKWKEDKAFPMVYTGSGKWEAEISYKSIEVIEYKYFIKRYYGTEWEFGDVRIISIPEQNSVKIRDWWRSKTNEQNVLKTSPFQEAFFKRAINKKVAPKSKAKANVQFSLMAVQIDPGISVCIGGDCAELGNWDEKKVKVLNDSDYPNWKVSLKVGNKVSSIRYKYGLYDITKKSVVSWETGDNRLAELEAQVDSQIFVDEHLRHPAGNWRGSGVAIPVFSIRSKSGLGVGEFSDLKLLVDWAVKTGMKAVQVLPINDTVATHTWVDSYPYAAISVFALHPIYANLNQMGHLDDAKETARFSELQRELNRLETIDYEAVLMAKSEYFKLLFDQDGSKTLSSKDFKAFYKRNNHWLKPYAAFSYLRDLNGTADFSQWGQYSKFNQDAIDKLVSPQSKNYKHIAINYFIQYHLDKQLRDSSEYARKHGVVLKGDIPIGIYRHSVDAWMTPELFNMEGQAGAPPDAFSTSGQNWGFPTYNWQQMAEDGFKWWRERMAKMADYFDVYRIDHILGFFRIWEIPWQHVEGTLGRFNPALPISIDELKTWGIDFNYQRMAKPYIVDYVVNEIFGEQAGAVKEQYLNNDFYGSYSLKEEFDTQRKIKDNFDHKNENGDQSHRDFIKKGLLQLARQVLFLEAPDSNGKAFNPNIDLNSTYSFRDLDDFTKNQLLELHRQYFFHRHNGFWREKGIEKLPAIKDATNMLVCGEDLGMVPACVPGVMDELQILSLAIQRMPNDNEKEFWHPADTPYLSVCSTGSHDTSTIRQWWEEDRDKTQRFYTNILGNHGEAPYYCEPWVVNQIITQHLYSPSMWAIFPIQDLLAMDGDIRRVFPQEEHINHPEIIPHYWRYRLHINMEDLLDEDEFNARLKEMVEQSGRG